MTKANEGAARRATALDAGPILSQQAGDEKLKTGQDGASPSTDRKFLFEYRFGGETWCVTIFAANPAEAKEKIKHVGLAQYKGEVHAEFKVPFGSMWHRIMQAWKRSL